MSNILAFGDSNTWGLIPGSKPHQRFPREVRWTGYEAIAARRGLHFLAASDVASPSSVDDEHFDEEGHKLFAQAVLTGIKEMHL